jgi:EamA domain-containing membrane protein RarD
MRKTFLILAIIFSVLGAVFSFFPFDSLAFLPIVLALVFSYLTFSKSEDNQKKLPKNLFIFSILCAVFVLGKTFLIKDEVEKDQIFEQTKIESTIEAKKDLEDLEDLE